MFWSLAQLLKCSLGESRNPHFTGTRHEHHGHVKCVYVREGGSSAESVGFLLQGGGSVLTDKEATASLLLWRILVPLGRA